MIFLVCWFQLVIVTICRGELRTIKRKQNKGLRMTQQRKAILEELSKTTCHPTATQVYKAVHERIPRISLGTVYRNLDVLSEAGLIQKLESGGSEKRFDGTTENHYHVRCVCCGRVEDVSGSQSNELESAVQEKTDYEIIGYWLEYRGLCPECKNRRASDEED